MTRQFPPIDPATIGRAMRDGRAYRFDGPARHVRIGPPLNPVPTRGEKITGYVATALSLFILVYFGAEMLRGWLA